MKIQVTIVETRQVFKTYEVEGVDSIEAAKKCAEKCYTDYRHSNTRLVREVPQAPTHRFDAVEVVEV